ncbi:hypothetical protein J2Z83_000921 [Virgibacillus natechei]|uniref:Uncharacterized protein n=1 Tax=Virgibacillus natechei TaxID=1216297 RepID=A0ABS4ID07_9BACI|nr:hypothetical protein [Virgibacillus natechei]MBP1968827.1 hypothetical protein [Virgibacillus natechei]UZD11625.1 hypothetical protein OLD84_11730 [Virgibacillus natechei]
MKGNYLVTIAYESFEKIVLTISKGNLLFAGEHISVKLVGLFGIIIGVFPEKYRTKKKYHHLLQSDKFHGGYVKLIS